MFVAASTECFPDLTLSEALLRLVDLEYTTVEIGIRETEGKLRPSQLTGDFDSVVTMCRDIHRLTPVALDIEPEVGDQYYQQFAACCRLAKALKIVAVTVPAAELGTPFNAEIERLRELVSIASGDGVLVGIKTETGRITQDPDTAVVLCDNVKGLRITLDPSHYVCGPYRNHNYEPVMKHVCHVHLRDTSKDKLQVRVGQGEIEYGRLISQLGKYQYNRALSVYITPESGIDHSAELRKMRLLLESLL